MGIQQSTAAFPYEVDGAPFSVFTFDKSKHDAQLGAAAFKRMKTLRHPQILSYVDGADTETHIHVVVEAVTPLSRDLTSLRAFPAALTWGVFQITKALAFMDNDCNLCHGNLRPETVFVNKAGDWKLGGLELTSNLDDMAPPLKTHNAMLPSEFHPPDFAGSFWDSLKRGGAQSLDAWLLACFVYEVLVGGFNGPASLRNAQALPTKLRRAFGALVLPQRRSLTKFASSPYFDSPYVRTCMFLEEMAIKDAYEKDTFFKDLPAQLDQFPDSMCKFKILPELVKALDYGTANFRVLRPLLKIGSQLSGDEYGLMVAPSVVKWFASPDRTLRVNLLKNLSSFVDHLSPDMVENHIFEHVCTGFTDRAPVLRELTVKSMLDLAPKLKESTLRSQVLRFFAKLQTDPEPGIRTNTTICLGKISPYLSEDTRNKVLIPAFARALRDPFPPTRRAALMSFSATEAYYAARDCAVKIMPAVSMLSVDADGTVREAALQCMRLMLTKIERSHADRAAGRAPATPGAGGEGVATGAQGGGASGKAVSAVTTAATGVLGWALTSITSKLVGSADEDGGLASTGAEPQSHAAAGTNAHRTATTTSFSTARGVTPFSKAASAATGSIGDTDEDAWGALDSDGGDDEDGDDDDDGWGDWGTPSKVKATTKPATPSTAASPSKPKPKPKPRAGRPRKTRGNRATVKGRVKKKKPEKMTPAAATVASFDWADDLAPAAGEGDTAAASSSSGWGLDDDGDSEGDGFSLGVGGGGAGGSKGSQSGTDGTASVSGWDLGDGDDADDADEGDGDGWNAWSTPGTASTTVPKAAAAPSPRPDTTSATATSPKSTLLSSLDTKAGDPFAALVSFGEGADAEADTGVADGWGDNDDDDEGWGADDDFAIPSTTVAPSSTSAAPSTTAESVLRPAASPAPVTATAWGGNDDADVGKGLDDLLGKRDDDDDDDDLAPASANKTSAFSFVRDEPLPGVSADDEGAWDFDAPSTPTPAAPAAAEADDWGDFANTAAPAKVSKLEARRKRKMRTKRKS